MIRRLIAALALVTALCGFTLPNSTTNRVGWAQIFSYGVPNLNSLLGNTDVIWNTGDASDVYRTPPAGISGTAYIPVERSSSLWALANWQANLPQCIVYNGDTKTPAYEFGDSAVPIAIWNPTCQAELIALGVTGIVTSLLNLGVDNVSIANNQSGVCSVVMPSGESCVAAGGTWSTNGSDAQARRGTCSVVPDSTSCVHAGGTWIQRYTGVADSQWVTDTAAWLAVLQTDVNGLGAYLMTNQTFQGNGASAGSSVWNALIANTNAILVESDVWEGCVPSGTGYGQNWIDRTGAYAGAGKPLVSVNYLTDVANGATPPGACGAPGQVSAQELDFVLASIMMVAGDHTYWGGNAYTSNANYELIPKAPWNQIVHGGFTGAAAVNASGTYYRIGNNGQIFLVNPNSTQSKYTLTGTYHHLWGQNVSGTITLDPSSSTFGSGMVLIPGAWSGGQVLLKN